MYTPKNNTELRNILEALRTFTSLQGMQDLSEILEDAEITLAMEELKSENLKAKARNDEEPASG